MLDLLRPVAQLARPLRPIGGHDFARGSLGLKTGVGAASGGTSCAAPTKKVTNVGGDAYDEDDFLRRLRLVTSRVLVADAIIALRDADADNSGEAHFRVL
jgi:hypothetical protein